MLSQTVEYSLRAVVYLTGIAPASASTNTIAKATKVPPAYLAKVIRALVKSGILASRRGIGGGVVLHRKPDELTILEVVNAVEPIQRIRTCPLQLSSHGTNLCPLHKRVDTAIATVEAAFARTTLAELMAEPTTSIPLCDISGPQLQALNVKSN
ncbi:MAG: Rrf2 family transcriptional regulator [Gemmataceae bacterium]